MTTPEDRIRILLAAAQGVYLRTRSVEQLTSDIALLARLLLED